MNASIPASAIRIGPPELQILFYSAFKHDTDANGDVNSPRDPAPANAPPANAPATSRSVLNALSRECFRYSCLHMW